MQYTQLLRFHNNFMSEGVLNYISKAVIMNSCFQAKHLFCIGTVFHRVNKNF